MEHEKKLAFIAKMTKMGLDHIQHMDTGGALLSGPSVATGGNNSTMAGGLGGGIDNFLGTNNNFQATAAPIQQGTNASQLNSAYTGAQSGLTQQQELANETAPITQQGLNAESTLSGQLANEAAGAGPNPAQAALAQTTGNNVANTAALIAGQRGASSNAGLAARTAAQQGAATQQNAAGQAATLEAQQQLAAQQAQAGLAGTEVGQGTSAVQGVNNAQQNEQNILQGANTSGNNANVSSQSNINTTNAAVATGNQNAAQNTAGGLLGGISSGISSLFAKGGLVKMDRGGNVLDANARDHIAPDNFALPGRRYPIHDVNHARNALARVSQNGTPDEKKKVRAAVERKYPSLNGKKMADGGPVSPQDAQNVKNGMSNPNASTPIEPKPIDSGLSDSLKSAFGKMASGGYVTPTPLTVNQNAPQSFVGQWLNSNPQVSSPPPVSPGPTIPTVSSDSISSKIGPKLPGQKPASPASTSGGSALGDIGTGDAVEGAAFDAAALGYRGGVMKKGANGELMKTGGKVIAVDKSEKANVPGDSLKNDKIPAVLSENEVVLDRDTLADPGPIGQMARVVAKHIERRNKGKAK